MIISILDYGSGNIKSVSKAVEYAALNLGKSARVQVIADINKIKLSDKIILPGQGSFKQCADTLFKMTGAIDELNEFVIQKKKYILAFVLGCNFF